MADLSNNPLLIRYFRLWTPRQIAERTGVRCLFSVILALATSALFSTLPAAVMLDEVVLWLMFPFFILCCIFLLRSLDRFSDSTLPEEFHLSNLHEDAIVGGLLLPRTFFYLIQLFFYLIFLHFFDAALVYTSLPAYLVFVILLLMVLEWSLRLTVLTYFIFEGPSRFFAAFANGIAGALMAYGGAGLLSRIENVYNFNLILMGSAVMVLLVLSLLTWKESVRHLGKLYRRWLLRKLDREEGSAPSHRKKYMREEEDSL